jgi:hypothetical protein
MRVDVARDLMWGQFQHVSQREFGEQVMMCAHLNPLKHGVLDFVLIAKPNNILG